MTTVNQLLCPRDGAVLIKSIKNSIEIEYCPVCGGVWLDHGELEKLISLASQPKFGPPSIDAPQQTRPDQYQQYPQQQGYHHKKKKENWLGEIFDF